MPEEIEIRFAGIGQVIDINWDHAQRKWVGVNWKLNCTDRKMGKPPLGMILCRRRLRKSGALLE